MPETFRSRAERAPLSWSPDKGGRSCWLTFVDDRTYDLGPDVGNRFVRIAQKMMSGIYYPPDAIQVEGRFLDENRPLRVGDRIIQAAPVLGIPAGPKLRSAVEIFVADISEVRCHIGYVTTKMHFGRGIWQAELTRSEGQLHLQVRSTTIPSSILFWIGLPIARYLQMRAWRRAVEEFRKF